MHWADASTIDLLTYLAPQFADVCVLLVVTSRPSDLLLTNHPFLSLRRDLQARRLGHELTLEMLTRGDVSGISRSGCRTIGFRRSCRI